jgi:release factor glutamine methyltransferase
VNRRQALARDRDILADHHIEDAYLEAEILLRHVLGTDRARFLAGLEEAISDSQVSMFLKLVQRRAGGEPSAYIVGHREFYGLNFFVDPRVLIPRPETELLVEKALEICRSSPVKTITDVGTGCGNIAVSLAVILRDVKIRAIDISIEALLVAEQNAALNEVKSRISFLQGNLLKPLRKPVDMIVANLPYVKSSDLPANGFEPELALDGGGDGLDIMRSLGSQVKGKLNLPGWLLLEIGLGQAEAVTQELKGTFTAAQIEVSRDLAGIERLVCLRLTQRRAQC